MTINHCEKHKNFIPSCTDCIAKRDALLNDNQEPKSEKVQPSTRTEIIDTKPTSITKGEWELEVLKKIRFEIKDCFFTLPFEKVIVTPQNIPITHLYCCVMEEHGYEFVSQITPTIRQDMNVYLLFKKIK